MVILFYKKTILSQMRKKIIFSLIAVVLLVIIAILVKAVWMGKGNALNTAEINGNIFNVEIADSEFSRLKGLRGRESLDENKGMLFLFEEKTSPVFWMKGVKFPLDLIWIDDDVIVGITENAIPAESIPAEGIKLYSLEDKPVNKVLEINGGLSEKLNISIGDKVIINIAE